MLKSKISILVQMVLTALKKGRKRKSHPDQTDDERLISIRAFVCVIELILC